MSRSRTRCSHKPIVTRHKRPSPDLSQSPANPARPMSRSLKRSWTPAADRQVSESRTQLAHNVSPRQFKRTTRTKMKGPLSRLHLVSLPSQRRIMIMSHRQRHFASALHLPDLRRLFSTKPPRLIFRRLAPRPAPPLLLVLLVLLRTLLLCLPRPSLHPNLHPRNNVWRKDMHSCPVRQLYRHRGTKSTTMTKTIKLWRMGINLPVLYLLWCWPTMSGLHGQP